MGFMGLYSYGCSQGGDDLESLVGEPSRQKLTTRVEGSSDEINDHVSVTKMRLQVEKHLCFYLERDGIRQVLNNHMAASDHEL